MRSQKAGAAALSVASNSILVVLKLVVGVLSGSIGIISEAAHSAIDLLAAVMAYFSVRASDDPPDERHPFGHGKIENLSGTLEAVLILGVAVFIVYEAMKKLLHPAEIDRLWLAIAVMLLSSVMNFLVSSWLFRVAHRTDSIALKADAEHLRVDVITSAGVFVGLGIIKFTGWHILDPIIALIVAALIVGIAVRLTREAGAPLLDIQLPREEFERIGEIIMEDPRILHYHKLRTRKSGAQRHIDVHIQVDRDLSLSEAHEVAEDAEDRIRERLAGVHVITHVEPDTEIEQEEIAARVREGKQRDGSGTG